MKQFFYLAKLVSKTETLFKIGESDDVFSRMKQLSYQYGKCEVKLLSLYKNNYVIHPKDCKKYKDQTSQSIEAHIKMLLNCGDDSPDGLGEIEMITKETFKYIGNEFEHKPETYIKRWLDNTLNLKQFKLR